MKRDIVSTEPMEIKMVSHEVVEKGVLKSRLYPSPQ
jgi:hypothetical protein